MKRRHPLRRIMIGVAATASGVVLLLALKQPSGSSVAVATVPPGGAAAPGAAAPRTAGGAPSEGAPAADVPAADAPAAGAPDDSAADEAGADTSGAPASKAPAANRPTKAAPPRERTVLGDAVDTQYGPVQVRLTLSGTRIVSAAAVQAPGSDAQSKSVTANAVPKLNQAAVTAQSARIDAVSGASYTSKGYQDSLQSALDKAGA
ncbi:FMN-binding protein [Streptomyces liangshanensis]|uniref:FMN-binding protein n=1 Tax=Streptomyces liangshanensis TaxID=2717324 RepID=A0A6G9GT10_9ACTN|nr:FMN-binding protein [Streptomyces liangshanensis]QIQ01209.1 FMN-binding protein [Streptomyces liangshanensis]